MKKIVLVVVLMAIACTAFAVEPEIDEPITSSFWQSVFKDLKQPFVTESRQILITGVLATGALLATRNDTIDPLQESVANREILGDTAPIFRLVGEWVPNLAYIGVMAFDGWYNNQEKSYYRSGLMIRTMASACILTATLKHITNQKRPGLTENRRSFPSGHTTTSFVFASIVGAEHGWKWGVPAYALATVSGFSRIDDNKHFLHDVVMGASIGTAYGIALSKANRKFSLSGRNKKPYDLFWAPYSTGEATGLTLLVSY